MFRLSQPCTPGFPLDPADVRLGDARDLRQLPLGQAASLARLGELEAKSEPGFEPAAQLGLRRSLVAFCPSAHSLNFVPMTPSLGRQIQYVS
jgi:hypothetical protein